MTTTQIHFSFETRDHREVETLLDITYHRTGPVAVVTHIAEAHGWQRVPDALWGDVEDAAAEHCDELAAEAYADECDDSDPAADCLAAIRRDIVAHERGMVL